LKKQEQEKLSKKKKLQEQDQSLGVKEAGLEGVDQKSPPRVQLLFKQQSRLPKMKLLILSFMLVKSILEIQSIYWAGGEMPMMLHKEDLIVLGLLHGHFHKQV
jgi:hypothetical protein